MLSEQAFINYCCQQHALLPATIAYIDTVRNSEPSRTVGTNAKNNLCTYPVSKKMGHSLSLESRGPEKAFFILSEYDDRILEIWDQPEAVKISGTNKNGRIYRSWYTPDFLVLTRDGPMVIEAKTEEDVEELLKKRPIDWRASEEERVSYIPALNAFSDMGLNHGVFVYKKSMIYKIDNLELLLLSRSADRYEASKLECVQSALSECFYLSLYDLKDIANLDSYEDLIQMVDDKKIYVDLKNTLLASPKGCVVTLDPILIPEAMKLHHARKIYKGREFADLSIEKVPKAKHAVRALRNLELIKNGARTRNTLRLKKKICDGESVGLTPFQSLIPNYAQSGNRVARLPHVVESFLHGYLVGEFAQSQGTSVYRAHKRYYEDAKDFHPGIDPVSIKTFKNRLERIPPEKIAYARGGNRSANAVMPPSDPDDRSLEAQCAWRAASADHYEADIFVVIFDSSNYVYVARPYVTGLIDLYSKAVIGFSISLLPPSRRSISKAIRDCVRRHGKLPEEIIVDRGSDFKSVFFAALLAGLGITLTMRPSAHPRFGSEIEGLFGEFKKMWLSQRPGNICDQKELRSVDGNKSPEKRAVLRPYDFFREFERFVEWRDSKQRGIGVESAYAALMRSAQEFPFVGRKVEINTEFLVASSVDDKPYKIDFQRGLHIGDQHYWSPKISGLRGIAKSVDTRPDPENPHIVYALLGNEWTPCASGKINAHSALDPISQQVAGLELVEAVSIKRAIREQADTELVHILREMDAISSSKNVIPIASVLENGASEQNLFEQLRNANIEPIESTSWES